MKNFLILIAILITAPTYAICLIDSGEAVCAVPKTKQSFNSMFMDRSNTTQPNNSSTLQPKNKENPMNNMRGQNNTLNNNSNCAFGNCLNNTTNSKRLRDTNP